MESASTLSALAQPFGVGDAIKSWFELFNLFLEANQIIGAEKLHASAFPEIVKFQELLERQLRVITFSRSLILFTGRELHNFPLDSAGLSGARRVDPLKVIRSLISATHQVCRHAYKRKRIARHGLPAVESRSFNQPSLNFTDCESFSSLSSTTHCRCNLSSFEKLEVICLNSPSISCSSRLLPKAPVSSFTSIPRSYTYNTVVPSIPSTTPDN